MTPPERPTHLRLGGGGRTRNWWRVRARNDRYVVLTRQAAFHPAGVLEYTIIDWRRSVRGPCNLIGGGWGEGTFSDSECAELLEALQNHDDNRHILDESPDEMWEPTTNPVGRRWVGPDLPESVEVSYRNNVPVDVLEVK